MFVCGGVKASSHVKTGRGDDREGVGQAQDENLELGNPGVKEIRKLLVKKRSHNLLRYFNGEQPT